MDHGRAGMGELHEGGAAHELGVVDHGRAGDRHGPGRAEDRHGVEADRDAGLGQGQGEVHAEALLMERAHRADDGGEGRPLAQLVAAAGEGGAHLDQAARFPVLLDGDHDAVLGRVAHAGVELVKHAALDRAVLGAHHGRGGRDVVERLHDAGAVLEVFLARRAHHAGGRVAVEHAAAVGGDVEVLAVERQVVLGRAAAERELVRHRGERPLDHLAGHLGDGRLAVDRRAVLLEHVEGVLGVEHDADVLDHVERRLVDLLERRRGSAARA